MKQKRKEFDSTALPKYVPTMTWAETEAALASIELQFKVLHDLPKLADERKPHEYMHEALHGLRQRCREIGERRTQLLMKK